MTKKTRLIILIICFLLFFTITPWLVLYSLGYKIDFKNQCIVATGGIYVRADPAGVEMTVDGKKTQKAGLFSNSIFIQNLSPKIHEVVVKKDNYFWYIKNIAVEQNEVTKIENITLFKNTVAWENLDKTLAKNLFPTPSPKKKNMVAYTQDENNIIWLGSDGNLNKSDIFGKNTEILTNSPILINKNNSYKIFNTSFGIF